MFSLSTNIYDSSVTVVGWLHEDEGREVVNVKGQVRFTWLFSSLLQLFRVTSSSTNGRITGKSPEPAVGTLCTAKHMRRAADDCRGRESHVIRSALPPTCLTRYHPNRENYHSAPSPPFLSKSTDLRQLWCYFCSFPIIWSLLDTERKPIEIFFCLGDKMLDWAYTVTLLMT